jgi:uncharacterized protein involved in exopolysaccharide biosynthesis
VNSTDLIKEIFKRLIRYKLLLLAGGIFVMVLSFFYASTKRASYTSKATVFPLTHPNDNALTNSTLSGILGLGDAPKSFSSEATINIIELALSRNVREAVASTRLPNFGNKTVTELLVKNENDNKALFAKEIKIPIDSIDAAVMGGQMLKASVNAKMSKNGVLELYYTGTNEQLITPISNVIVGKISQFYVDLKREKALSDYNFTLDKIDSFQNMIKGIDQQAIHIQRTTLFTPTDLLEYNLPKENINQDKIRIARQRDMSINNRDEAVWRLQKVTPIIAVLDKPNPPFDVLKPSRVLFAVLGFIVGILMTILLLISGLLYRFAKTEIYKGIFGEAAAATI